MIRFTSINIEGDKHLKEVLSFLAGFKPDAVCFQELCEPAISFFEKELGMKGYFLPMLKYHVILQDQTSPIVAYGVGIFSALPVSGVRHDSYYDRFDDVPSFVIADETTTRRVLLRATIRKGEDSYTVATTHFTRTPDGSTSDKQREDLKNMLALLSDTPEVILCGDFNAPRGGEIFGKLAQQFKDNIPPRYLSSLDPKLHTLKDSKPLMVDGLFTTSQYRVTDVQLSSGVSDHLAVTALIEKK